MSDDYGALAIRNLLEHHYDYEYTQAGRIFLFNSDVTLSTELYEDVVHFGGVITLKDDGNFLVIRPADD